MDPTERLAVGLASVGLALAFVDVAAPAWRGWYVGSDAQAALHAGVAAAGALLLLLDQATRPRVARGLGIALLALAALATLSPTLLGQAPRAGLAFEALENAAHAMLGAWGVHAARQET